MAKDVGYGRLCHKAGKGSLCFKKGGGALVYKAKPKPGDVAVTIVSDQSAVGPIKSCGNEHSVLVSPAGTFTEGSGTASVSGSGYGVILMTISVTKAPAAVEVNCPTSTGCAYPEENPSMGFAIGAAQRNGGQPKTTRKGVGNVSNGAFAFTVTIDEDMRLKGLD